MSTTLDDVASEAITQAEFPPYDLDSLCIHVELVDVVAEALGLDLGYADRWDDPEVTAALGQANIVLAALVAKGFVRRSDFVYVEGVGTQRA